jgi:MOSC domain-containing protein YiiM
MNEGKLQAIWIKRVRRQPMDPADSAQLVAGRGIVGNSDQGGLRQVTVIEQAVWDDLMSRLGASASSSERRANLLVKGIDLANSGGRILRVGECRIRIAGETRPCDRMDEAVPGLKEAMKDDWFGGAFGEVLDGGQISVGDSVGWVD